MKKALQILCDIALFVPALLGYLIVLVANAIGGLVCGLRDYFTGHE